MEEDKKTNKNHPMNNEQIIQKQIEILKKLIELTDLQLEELKK